MTQLAENLRAFLATAKQSLRALPPEGEVYDSNLPAPILGAFYGQYDRAPRFVAPLVPVVVAVMVPGLALAASISADSEV